MMFSNHNARLRGMALALTILLTSLGSAVSGNRIEPAPDTRVGVGAPVRLAQATPAKVSYSAEQAKRGKARYDKDCEDCHGKDLKGGLNGGAPLRGGQFERKFVGAPASALFSYMSTQMPPNSPGRYSKWTYADLMAYILKRNGYQPGAPLPAEIEALGNLSLEK